MMGLWTTLVIAIFFLFLILEFIEEDRDAPQERGERRIERMNAEITSPEGMTDGQALVDEFELATRRIAFIEAGARGSAAMIDREYWSQTKRWRDEAHRALLDHLKTAERKLERLECPICLGTPHASGKPCVCGGTNDIRKAFDYFQRELHDESARLAALRKAVEEVQGNDPGFLRFIGSSYGLDRTHQEILNRIADILVAIRRQAKAGGEEPNDG